MSRHDEPPAPTPYVARIQQQLTTQLTAAGFSVQHGDAGAYLSWQPPVLHLDSTAPSSVASLAHGLAHVLVHAPGTYRCHDAADTTCTGQVQHETQQFTTILLTRLGLTTPTTAAAPATELTPTATARITTTVSQVLARIGYGPAGPTVDTGRLISVQRRAATTAARLVPVPESEPSSHEQRLIAAHDLAADLYRQELHHDHGQPARETLSSRGFEHLLAVDSPFGIGYAPPQWTFVTKQLRSAGFSDEELVDSGLATQGRYGLIDRFRDRVMFPIRNEHGHLVAFIGRALVDTSGPKYLNSPDTSIYSKRSVLFGLYEAGPALAAGARPIIVEGPLDDYAIHAISTPTDPLAPVATAGTALTPEHVASLARFANPARGVAVAFDADRAGRRAAAAAHDLLAHYKGPRLAVDLHDRLDPAAILATYGRQELRAALSRTRPLADRLLDDRLDGLSLDGVDAQILAARSAVKAIAALPADDVARQVSRLADHTGLDVEVITHLLVEAATTRTERRRKYDPAAAAPAPSASGLALPHLPPPTAQSRNETTPQPRERRRSPRRRQLRHRS